MKNAILYCKVSYAHNTIKTCVEYVHGLFISANRIFTLSNRCERPVNQSSSHTLYLYDK